MKSIVTMVVGSVLIHADTWLWGTVYLAFIGAGLLVWSMFLLQGE